MRWLFFILFIIPLVMYSQEVFASSYMHGGQGYTTYSTSSLFLQNNNQNLKNDVCDYNKTIPDNLKKLERPPRNNDSTFYDNTRQKPASPDPSERQPRTPDWWRQEGSFEGWGFD
ncbi:MAG: hypothetical protein K6A44_04130 [bacterium]|nr:hypothetical protein [bacterium]